MIRQQLSRVHCRHGAWRTQRYVVFCLNAWPRVTVMTTSWTKESNFDKIKPLLIGQLQRKVYHRVYQSLICSSEKSEPHLFPYSRVVVRFVACCEYNVDRCSFAPKDGVSRQKTQPKVILPYFFIWSKCIALGTVKIWVFGFRIFSDTISLYFSSSSYLKGVCNIFAVFNTQKSFSGSIFNPAVYILRKIWM